MSDNSVSTKQIARERFQSGDKKFIEAVGFHKRALRNRMMIMDITSSTSHVDIQEFSQEIRVTLNEHATLPEQKIMNVCKDTFGVIAETFQIDVHKIRGRQEAIIRMPVDFITLVQEMFPISPHRAI